MAGSSIKGIVVEIGGDTSRLQKALSKVNSVTSSLSKELRGINSLLKIDPKNTELLSQKQKVLNDEIAVTSTKLKELKQHQEDITSSGKVLDEEQQKTYRNLQREIIKTEEKLKQLKVEASNWTIVGRNIEEFGNKVTNISSKIDKLGSTLTKTLTLPVLGLATATIKASKDFETAFTGVEKTVDGTAEQMKKLKQGIKDMSEELPSSTTEIAAVAEAAGQLGIQTDNVLDFTKTMINMGNATNLSADEAATTLARFANITQMSQKDFDKLGSVIVALGNNFATTEAEIADMGMNLASAGTQVGMSQSQIMALATALSSVGLEAQAGGTAFSKVMVNMQLAVEKGGDSLEDFAAVAGMSGKQFKKAFKEDATKAIMKFVEGLSKSGQRGKSAIKVLDDMEIKETRLRDALLRSANASGVMSKAIELGNKAWNENSALTNEANKRYETLESRMQKTKNKILNVATSTGDKLTPTFNKLLDKVDNLVDKFGNLNEEEITNIIKTAALVAAIGPATKIIGTLGTTVGNVSKGIGQFSQAIAVAQNKTTSNVTSINSLATAMKLLATPTGIMTTAIIAGTAAIIAYENEQQKALGNSRETKKAIDNEVKAREELIQAQQKQIDSGMTEIARTQELYNELKTITDENGKIKEGYEKRANYIITELNKALDIEIKKNGNVIESYQTIQYEINKCILKKKAELILAKQEETYTTALQNREEAYIRLEELQNSYTEAIKKYHSTSGREQMEAKKAMAGLQYQLEQQQKLVDGYNSDIATYENNYALMCENTTESLNELVNNTQVGIKKQTDDTYDGITKQIEYYTKLTKDYKKLKDEQLKKGNEYRANEYNQQEESNRKQLEQLSEQLAQITTETNINEPKIQNAWKNIADNSNVAFFKVIDEMPESLRNKLLRMSGIINEDITIENASNQLGKDTSIAFSNATDDMPGDLRNRILSMSGVINEDTAIENASRQLGNDANANFRSGITRENGRIATEDYMAGAQRGLENRKHGFFSSLFNIGRQGNANMRQGLGDGSPSKLAKEALIDYFLGADIGIEKQGNKTIKNIQDMRN